MDSGIGLYVSKGLLLDVKYLSASTDIQLSHQLISKDSFGHKVMKRESLVLSIRRRKNPSTQHRHLDSRYSALDDSHSSRAKRLDLISVGAPSKAVELDIDPSNLLLVRNVKQVEALDVVGALANAAESPLPEALVAVGNVDLAGLDVLDWVLLHAFVPLVAGVEDGGADLGDLLVFCCVK